MFLDEFCLILGFILDFDTLISSFVSPLRSSVTRFVCKIVILEFSYPLLKFLSVYPHSLIFRRRLESFVGCHNTGCLRPSL